MFSIWKQNYLRPHFKLVSHYCFVHKNFINYKQRNIEYLSLPPDAELPDSDRVDGLAEPGWTSQVSRLGVSSLPSQNCSGRVPAQPRPRLPLPPGRVPGILLQLLPPALDPGPPLQPRHQAHDRGRTHFSDDIPLYPLPQPAAPAPVEEGVDVAEEVAGEGVVPGEIVIRKPVTSLPALPTSPLDRKTLAPVIPAGIAQATQPEFVHKIFEVRPAGQGLGPLTRILRTRKWLRASSSSSTARSPRSCRNCPQGWSSSELQYLSTTSVTRHHMLPLTTLLVNPTNYSV